jgi:hypothetical protein
MNSILWPSAHLVGSCFLAVVGVVILWADFRRHTPGRVSAWVLLSLCVVGFALCRLVLLLWNGGGVRKGRRRSYDVTLEDAATVWLGQLTPARGIALEMWATCEDPPIPPVDVTYSLRRADCGARGDGAEVLLPGHAPPPSWLRTRHAQPRPVVFSNLIPGASYEYGICIPRPVRLPRTLRLNVVRTVSAKALLNWRRIRGNAGYMHRGGL